VFWIFLSFIVVSVFSSASVAVWASTKHRERKDFYRGETLKKLAESGAAAVTEYLREEERLEEARRVAQRQRVVEGNRLVGLILLVVGGTLLVALRQLVPEQPVYLLSLAPMGIGVVFFMTPLLSSRS
jgi:ABC-type uncharacterized transport system substrate-binding protein